MKRQRTGHFSTHTEEVNQILSLKSKLSPAQKWASTPCRENWTHNIDHLFGTNEHTVCILMLKCFICLAAFWGLQVTKMASAALTSKHLVGCKESKKTNFCFGAFSCVIHVRLALLLRSLLTSAHSYLSPTYCATPIHFLSTTALEWFGFERFTQGLQDNSNNNNHSLSPLRFSLQALGLQPQTFSTEAPSLSCEPRMP